MIRVSDETTNPNGFKDGLNEIDYKYDDFGNMEIDVNKGITNISYNHLNLPLKITFGGNKYIQYLYNATGQKISKTITDGSVVTITEYLDGFQYSKVNNTAAVVLDFFPHAEGYVKVSGESTDYDYSYVYNYLDHLGNVRLSYGTEPNGDVVKILEENNYYPFGMKHNNYNVDKKQYEKYGSELYIEYCTNCSYKYKYNGKEFQDELGLNLYDYGARNYDPAIARWMNVDPLAEVSRRWSPYTYCYNNPIRFVDPDGMMADDSIDPKFQDDATKNAYISTVENATGNTYKVTSDPLINGGRVGFIQVAAGPVTQEQQAFIDVYKDAVDSPAVANVEVVSNDVNVTIGDIINNKIDISDIAEFDKAGSGAASSAGALAHETKEQQLKAESGGVKGVYPAGATNMCNLAIRTAENKVNGNFRKEDVKNGIDTFFERDGTKTTQTVTPNTSTGGIKVVKTKIP